MTTLSLLRQTDDMSGLFDTIKQVPLRHLSQDRPQDPKARPTVDDDKVQFESFMGAGQTDILDKTVRLGTFLRQRQDANTTGAIEQSLGVQLLEAAAPRAAICNRDGERQNVIMLGSNSYLDLTRHPQVITAAKSALEHYGYGMGAVSLYAGITDLHRKLEQAIADFCGTEDAIVFPGGYGTNVGVISALCGPGDVIINDSANHASIFDGSRLSGADCKLYPHGNMKRLEQVLRRLPAEQKGRLIITDGVFSMHGDLARLDVITELAEKYKARVMVDDAHGIGIVGPGGRGTAAEFGVADKIDLHVSMLSKAPGGLGGYCAARADTVRFLRFYARTYFFSTALPAPIVAGLYQVFQLLAADAAGREKLWENIRYMQNGIQDLGFSTTPPTSGIIPVIVGDEAKLAALHRALLNLGVYTNIVTYPAVRRKECRLRLCIMASLTKEDMDTALAAFETAGAKCGIR